MASDFKEQCSTSNIQQPVPAEPLPVITRVISAFKQIVLIFSNTVFRTRTRSGMSTTGTTKSLNLSRIL